MTQSTEIINVDEYKGYRLTSRDPFGFWDVNPLEGGTVPKDLSGKFTTMIDAHKKIDSHIKSEELKIKNAAVEHMKKVQEQKRKAEEDKALQAKIEAKAKQLAEEAEAKEAKEAKPTSK